MLDDGSGDPDLLLHQLVARQRGIGLAGPDPSTAFGEIPRSLVLAGLDAELQWGLGSADQKYAVLNACRALAFALEGTVLSKVEGGEWALGLVEDPGLLREALEAQRRGAELGPAGPRARAVVDSCRRRLRDRRRG